MPTVHTFFWLPDEHEEFVNYLATFPDAWARFVADDPDTPALPPAPVAQFVGALNDHADRDWSVYIGSRDAVLDPPINVAERIEGGTHVPFVQFGQVVSGASTIVGGTKVKFRVINGMAAELISYRPGRLRGTLADVAHAVLSQSNLHYYSTGVIRGGDGERGCPLTTVTKSKEFHAWAKRVVAWVRRRTKATVPASSGNATLPSTMRVAEAHSAGLALTY